jgi:hypothetical protein
LTQRIAFKRAESLASATTQLSTLKEQVAGQKIQSAGDLAVDAQSKLAVLQKAASDAEAAQKRVEIDLEKQREKTANAETQLLQLAKKQAGRTIAKGSLSSLLIGKPTGLVRIEYEPDDTEAYQYAMDIFTELTGTRWKINRVEKIADNASLASSLPPEGRKFMTEQELAAERQLFPISVRRGGGAGLALLANSIQIDSSTNQAFVALRAALLAVNSQIATRVDSALPDNSFIIVVGPKP